MRMIFVHGINQQGKSSQKILDDWQACLKEACHRVAPGALDKLSGFEAPFYGDALYELSSKTYKDQTIALGAEEAPDDFVEFALAPIEEMALKLGVSNAQLAEAKREIAVPQGAGYNKEWIKAIGRVIEAVSPLHGTLVLRVLGQAHAYIRNAYIHSEINKLVKPSLASNEPLIIVSHSLGTLVAFSLLREYAKENNPRQVPLFVTLGSPLGIDTVRKHFAMPRTKPNNVIRWVNGADPADFVALRPELTADNFAPGIENYPDIRNGTKDPHAICDYLHDQRIAKAITDSIP